MSFSRENGCAEDDPTPWGPASIVSRKAVDVKDERG
jgi:hypothetical protein